MREGEEGLEYMDFASIGEQELCICCVIGIRQKWKKRNSFRYLQRPRPDHGITLILCDSAVYSLKNGEELRAGRGDLVLIPEGTYYTVRFRPNAGTESDTLLLNFKLRDPLGNAVLLRGEPRILCQDPDGVLFDQMSAGIDAARRGKILSARRCLLACFEYALERLDRTQSDPFRLISAYLVQHVGKAHSVPALARRFAMSEATLRRLFLQRTGISPIAYLRRRKILQAEKMLRTPELSVESISEQLGFYDVAYFYKVFKRETGMTPAAYRKKIEQNTQNVSQ